MEVGDRLKDLNMSADEIDRLTKAFKDEKFREMLHDYAQELSDPENYKRYEEEIKLLEQERGNTIEFIHPEPFRALKTSVDGKQKCFINICGNDKVGKPSSEWAVSEEGRRGQRWSLPHSLHPGRHHTDQKGNKILIYDVIFHPDTLHIASKNRSFMDMVDNTAIQGIQKAFNVTLDGNNIKQMKTKYKGTPQPCVIRKPVPGYKPKEASEESDPLAFPYPPDTRLTVQTQAADNPKLIEHQKNKKATKPDYTIKYRSFIDMQDFRNSRDSAQSPRPKEIVVTINVPLLKAVSDASLEIREKLLLLECKEPAYKLELLLAYPVDEDKGEAKFNKQRGQLTVTLPVLPSREELEFVAGLTQTGTSDGDEKQEETSELEKEDTWNEREEEKKGGGDEEEGELKHQEQGEEKAVNKEVEEIVVEEEKVKKQDGEKQTELADVNLEERRQEDDTDAGGCQHKPEEAERERSDSGVTGFQCDSVAQRTDVADKDCEKGNQSVSITAEHPGCTEEDGEDPKTLKRETSDSLDGKVRLNCQQSC